MTSPDPPPGAESPPPSKRRSPRGKAPRTNIQEEPLPLSPAPRRPVVLVTCDDERADAARTTQLAAALTARGCVCRAIVPRELGGVRDAIVIFLGGAKLRHLARARLAGNLLLLDLRGLPAALRRLGVARLLDGAIFRNERQRRDFDRPRWTSRVIYEPPEPGLRPHEAAPGGLRVACFAANAASLHYGRIPGVAYIAGAPLPHALQFNCHLALHTGAREALYRPGTEVVNAAACGAVLVTPRDASAVELLGDDYPFFCAIDRPAVEAALARARELCGGPEWNAALALLRQVSAKAGLAAVVEQHLEHFAALERARSGAPAGLPPPAAE